MMKARTHGRGVAADRRRSMDFFDSFLRRQRERIDDAIYDDARDESEIDYFLSTLPNDLELVEYRR